MGNLVQLSDVKTRLQIASGFTTDDALFNQIIAGVSAAIERYCNRSFSGAISVTDVLDGGVDVLILSARPVASITSVTDQVSDSVVDSSLYDLDASGGLLYALPNPPDDFTLPVGMFDFANGGAIWGDGRRRWAVAYQAGFASVPLDIQEAALILIAGRYNRRDSLSREQIGDYSYQTEPGTKSGFPLEVEQLIDPYREVVF